MVSERRGGRDRARRWFSSICYRPLALVALGVALVQGGCGILESPGGDPRMIVPLQTSHAVIIPNLENSRAEAVDVLASVAGATGVLHWVAAQTGIDLAQPGGLRRGGIDPQQALVVFRHGDTVAVGVGVLSEGRFMALVREQLRRRGATLSQGEDGVASAVFPSRGDEAGASVVRWAMTPARVGLVVWGPTEEAARRTWDACRDTTGAWLSREDVAAAAAGSLGPGVLAWGHLEGAPSLSAVPASPALAPVVAALDALLFGLNRWTLIARRDEAGLRLRAVGAWSGVGGLPASWLDGSPPGPPMGRLLPRSTTLWAELEVNALKLRSLPDWIKKRVTQGRLSPALPATDALLGALGDEVGFGVLGLDAGATLDHLKRGLGDGVSRGRLAQWIHTITALRLRTTGLVSGLMEEIGTSLERGGYVVRPITLEGWQGLSARRARPKETWTVLGREDLLLVISGDGELERLRAVEQGRALPLVGEEEANPRRTLEVRTSFSRLTRELADKGVPPYFLEMLSDLEGIRLSVDIESRALVLRVLLPLEVAP